MTTIEGQDLLHVGGLRRDFSQGVDERLLVSGEHRIPSTLEGDGAHRLSAQAGAAHGPGEMAWEDFDFVGQREQLLVDTAVKLLRVLTRATG